jgi:hypothetical protein
MNLQLLDFQYGEALQLIFQDTCRHYQQQQTLDESFHAFNKSSSFHTARIPFPPPAVASITGQIVRQFLLVRMIKIPTEPGTRTPASIIVEQKPYHPFNHFGRHQ